MSAATLGPSQLRSDPSDDQLTALARQRNARRRHWWGRRTRDGHTGAWCYLCDQFVATWSGRWPQTESARLAIGAHRRLHLRELPDGSQSTPKE